MANIYAAWKSRGELVNRVVTECQGTFVAEEVSGKGNYVGSPYSRKLIWAGYNASPVYHRKSGAVRNERTGRLIKCDCEYAVNAGRYRSLSYTMDADYIEGTIHNPRAAVTRWRELEIAPFVLCFRATVPAMGGYEEKDFRLTQRRGSIDGRDCLIVELHGGPTELWVSSDDR
ncbi:MAG: hypothetical protein AB7F89_18410, partial [Pirellulaceae bacterium]